ncbi:hypothetical protein EON80_22270 [bacterium]|nr:MAG: hypothetical protein EON80_22270 [bacterium]
MMNNKPVPPHYANDLKLKPLAKVEVMTPDAIPPRVSSPDRLLFLLEEGVRTLTSPSRARQMVSELGQLITKATAEPAPPGSGVKVAQCNLSLSYLKQAARIKQAQLEANDPNDSTGEVAERLASAHQCALNLHYLAG